jgi:hypothetical protein
MRLFRSPFLTLFLVLRPGFEPGSTAREAVILDRTILPEQSSARGYSKVFGLIKIAISKKGVDLTLKK